MSTGSTDSLPLIPKQMPKWFWPLVVAVVVSLLSFTVVFLLTMRQLRRSEVVLKALEVCRNDPATRLRLGQPLSSGWVVMGESGENRQGQQVVSRLFRVKGSDNFASCRVHAIKHDSQWQLHTLQLYYEGDDSWVTLVGDPENLPENLQDVKRDKIKEQGLPPVPGIVPARSEQSETESSAADDNLPVHQTEVCP